MDLNRAGAALAVFCGGGAGSLSRYLLARAIARLNITELPLGTFAVNMAGCLAIGLLFGAFEIRMAPPWAHLLVVTGFLGGFTTFSSFGLETVRLLSGPDPLRGLLYALASTILGLLLAAAGLGLAFLVVKRP